MSNDWTKANAAGFCSEFKFHPNEAIWSANAYILKMSLVNATTETSGDPNNFKPLMPSWKIALKCKENRSKKKV